MRNVFLKGVCLHFSFPPLPFPPSSSSSESVRKKINNQQTNRYKTNRSLDGVK
jgi:hypothetical protein